MTRVLVTGATGFVGRALCPALAEAGFQVTAAVRDASTTVPSADRIVAVPDIGPNTDWTEALKDANAVVHLAARVHRMGEARNEALADNLRVNAEGTRRLAEAATEMDAKRFVFLSSVKVNGETTDGRAPFSEADAPAPQDSYAISKWEAEQALAKIAAAGALEPTILRPTLVYGPGVRANFLALLKICRAAPPLPFGSVDNRRSLLFVGNLADAIRCCLSRPEAAGKTYMISDGEDVSTSELIRRLARAMDRPARLVPCPPGLLRFLGILAGKRETVARLLDTLAVDGRKIRQDIGWSPPFTLGEGLARTAAWFAAAGDAGTKGS